MKHLIDFRVVECSPSPVVQVNNEGVVSKLLKGFIMMSIHVACTGREQESGEIRWPGENFEVISSESRWTMHLTHQEVKDGHIHDVQQPSASVIWRRLLHLITVIWVHLPPENTHKPTHRHFIITWPTPGGVLTFPECCILTLLSCACGTSVSRGSSRSCVWQDSGLAGRPPVSPRSGPVYHKGRARWSSSTSTRRRSRRYWLRREKHRFFWKCSSGWCVVIMETIHLLLYSLDYTHENIHVFLFIYF